MLFLFLIAIPLLLIVLLWIACSERNEGTLEEMEANPKLNTQIWELHFKRLQEHGRSKYRGRWEHMGPRGGIYTITASGNRNFKY